VTDRPPSRRLFIALPLPDHARTVIENLVEAVRADLPGRSGVRWVRTDGLHLTLRFLGPTTTERIEALRRLIGGIAAATAPIPIAIAGAGAFPSASRPRVLWLGLAEGGERVAELTGDLVPGLASLGWPSDERPFHAHLTLARTDGAPAGRQAATRLVELATDLRLELVCSELALMETHSGRGPARYEPVFAVPLGET
jgi:2'-5' RNA ligase